MIEKDPYAVLTAPGGKGRLRREGDRLRTEGGDTYPIEDGIVRMLGPVDRLLEAELEAQVIAAPQYLDERFLVIRYERTNARLVVEEMLGSATGAILDAGCGVGLLGRMW